MLRLSTAGQEQWQQLVSEKQPTFFSSSSSCPEFVRASHVSILVILSHTEQGIVLPCLCRPFGITGAHILASSILFNWSRTVTYVVSVPVCFRRLGVPAPLRLAGTEERTPSRSHQVWFNMTTLKLTL